MLKQIVISQEDFDVGEVCRQMRASHGAALGALVVFTGLVREHNPHAGDGSEVATLTLEHYPGMTEVSIDKILERAATRWPLLEVRVIHRVGTMHPTDQIVLVAAASAHRDAAFAAAEFVMDYLKTDAVFWKKEQTRSGAHWVESTEQDRVRAGQWVDS
jgi:molybdopterin synthase catalytic subunit